MFRYAFIALMATNLVTVGCMIPRYKFERVERQTIETQSTDPAQPSPPISLLELSTFNGAIGVKPHDEPTVFIEVQYTAYGASPEEAQSNAERMGCEYDVDGGTLSIQAVKPSEQWMAAAAFTVRVPRDCALKLKTSNGRVEVSDLDAAIDASTSNGAIELQSVGDVTVKTSNGAIAIQDANGSVSAKTSNGRIAYSGTLEGQKNELRTSNGRIEMKLAAGQAVELESSTSNGRITSTLPTQKILSEGKRFLNAIVGDAQQTSSKIVLKTSNGSITISPLGQPLDSAELLDSGMLDTNNAAEVDGSGKISL